MMNYRQIYVMNRYGKALVIAMLGERERERDGGREIGRQKDRGREGDGERDGMYVMTKMYLINALLIFKYYWYVKVHVNFKCI